MKNILALMLLTLSATGLLSVTKAPSFRVFVTISKAKDHIKMMTAAKPWLEKMAADNNFSIDISDDTAKLTDANLANYDVFIQLQQAPFDMSDKQQQAVQKFIESGKGWIGIHAGGLTGKSFYATNRRYWQWFEDFIGGVVYSPHPGFQNGTVIVEDRTHPVTKNLPAKFEVQDEWYEWDKSPRGNVRVLASADESTYKQNKSMGDHPAIWVNEKFDRMVYIAIGHDASLCVDKNYTTLIRDAILWASKK